jgi:hypothetical protein
MRNLKKLKFVTNIVCYLPRRLRPAPAVVGWYSALIVVVGWYSTLIGGG